MGRNDRPQNDAVADLARLVTQYGLCNQGTWPAAKQLNQMEDGFRNSPVAATRPTFVDRVRRERDGAHHEIETKRQAHVASQ